MNYYTGENEKDHPKKMKEFVFNISGYAVMRAETIEQARSELLDEQLFNTNVDIELESEEEIEE